MQYKYVCICCVQYIIGCILYVRYLEGWGVDVQLEAYKVGWSGCICNSKVYSMCI